MVLCRSTTKQYILLSFWSTLEWYMASAWAEHIVILLWEKVFWKSTKRSLPMNCYPFSLRGYMWIPSGNPWSSHTVWPFMNVLYSFKFDILGCPLLKNGTIIVLSSSLACSIWLLLQVATWVTYLWCPFLLLDRVHPKRIFTFDFFLAHPWFELLHLFFHIMNRYCWNIGRLCFCLFLHFLDLVAVLTFNNKSHEILMLCEKHTHLYIPDP